MGEVYLARQVGAEGFSSLVALKCVAGDEQREEDAKQRFVSEAKISARFEHSGLVKAQNLVRIDGRLYLVLEFVDGTSLRDINKTAAKLGRKVAGRARLLHRPVRGRGASLRPHAAGWRRRGGGLGSGTS